IRVFHVTGVQTCALPISLNRTFENKYAVEYGQLRALKVQADSLENDLKKARQALNHEIFGTKTDETSGVMGYGPYAKMKEANLRSEERRVGKEWRCRR